MVIVRLLKQRIKIEPLLVVFLYFVFDFLIPYTSPYALMMTTACWILAPTLVTLYSQLELRASKVVIIIFLELAIFWIANQLTAKGNVSGDANQAVSFGAFVGIGPSSANNYFLIIVSLNFVLSILVYFQKSRFASRRQDSQAQQVSAENLIIRPRKDFEVLMFFSLVFLTCPFFEAVIPNLRLVSTAPDFDSQQINAWFDYASRGYIPMKDFWFPYNGMIVFQDGLFGYLAIWTFLILIGIMLYQFVLLNTSRLIPLLLLVLILILCINYSVIAVRYFFPFVALLLACLGLSLRQFRPVYFVPLSTSLWMSPENAVVVYALFVIAIILNVFQIKQPRIFISLYVKAFAVVTTSLLLQVVVLAWNGSLINLLTFLGKPNESIQYSFSPIQGLRFNLNWDLTQNFRVTLFAIVVSVFVVSIANTLRNLKIKTPIKNEIYLLMVSFFSLSLLQKEIVRGGLTLWIATLLVLSTIGILNVKSEKDLCLFSGVRVFSILFKQRVFIITGAFLLMFATPVMAGSLTQVARSPQQVKFLAKELLGGNLSSVLFNSNWTSANANLEKILVSTLGTETSSLIRDDFFILGDRPDFYRALNKVPYWLMSQYNSSPIREQKKLISQIKERNPSYVIVDKRPEAITFDGIANSVRLYKIYQFLIPRFELYRSFENFDLLVEKQATSINFEYWNELLGRTVNLGSLPLAATEPQECHTNLRKCGEFLRIGPTKDGTQKIDVTCRNTSYTVLFNSIPSGSHGWISLDRLWFWEAQCTVLQSPNTTRFKGEIGGYLY